MCSRHGYVKLPLMLTGVGGRTGLRSAVGHGGHGGRVPRPRGQRGGRCAGIAAGAQAGVGGRARGRPGGAVRALAEPVADGSALSSDGASNILQAQAMLHGNPLLRGWWTSDVSFYTTELPEYALVVAVRGLSPDVVHICGALTYTLTVALAALLARGRATGRGRAGAGRGLAVAIMLAPSILGGTEVFLENPDHFGTSVPVLLLFLLVDWEEPGGTAPAGLRWSVPGRGLRAARLDPGWAMSCQWWRPRLRSRSVCAFRLVSGPSSADGRGTALRRARAAASRPTADAPPRIGARDRRARAARHHGARRLRQAAGSPAPGWPRSGSSRATPRLLGALDRAALRRQQPGRAAAGQ